METVYFHLEDVFLTGIVASKYKIYPTMFPGCIRLTKCYRFYVCRIGKRDR